jgi:hypothetical protein
VLDIALTLRHGRAVSHDAVHGMLTECLQDVSYDVPTMLCLLALLLNF